ncbi:hypothetical protein MTR67_000586, partial [Solanum verrucosum]
TKKSRQTPRYRGGASCQPARPKRVPECSPLGRRASQRAPDQSLNVEDWRPAPLRVPGTPDLPIRSPPFRTCSFVPMFSS